LFGGVSRFFDGRVDLFHFLQLAMEDVPTQPCEQDGRCDKAQSNFVDRLICLLIGVFASGLGFLCLSKGIDRTGNLGASIALLCYPLVFIGGCFSSKDFWISAFHEGGSMIQTVSSLRTSASIG
jgi:drug/metabolite transporter (DMT)-like permease